MEPLIQTYDHIYLRIRAEPEISLYVLCFGFLLLPLRNTQVLVDASDASRFVTASSTRKIVRQLIAGLNAEGLTSGDCVCVHSFNDVRTSNPARMPEAGVGYAKWRFLVFNAFDKSVYHRYGSWKTLLQHGENHWVQFSDP